MTRSILVALFLASSFHSSALSVGTFVQQHSYCGRASGSAYAYGIGGTPPYSYSWDIPSTDPNVSGLLPGIYTVTVTDAVLDEAVAQVEIQLLSGYGNSFGPGLPLSYCGSDPCAFAIWTGQDGVNAVYDPTSPRGPWPYSFSHPNLSSYGQTATCLNNNLPVYNLLFFSGTPGTPMTVDFWDADGCPGTIDLAIKPPFVAPQIQIVGVGPSCQNGFSGTMTVSVSGSVGKEFGIYARRANAYPACYATDVQGFTYGNGDLLDGLQTFNGLAPGDHYLIWTTDPYGQYVNTSYEYECRDSILFTVPLVAADCGNLTGHLYLDDDADCIMDFAENRIPYSIVRVDPGPYYLTTNATGQYASALPYGSYTITEQHPVFQQSCPAAFVLSGPIPVTANTGCAGGQPLDVMVSAASSAARPGFELVYAVHVRNLTPASTGTVTLTLEMDPLLSFINAVPAPSSVVGGSITWTAPVFTMTSIFQERHFVVRMQVPPDVGLIGTVLSATATIDTQNTDGDPANNVAVTEVTVTGSFDPNDKRAATSSRASDVLYDLQQDEWIDYVIRFQNTGNDTAFNVLITDTLPYTLDPGSLLMGAASHPYAWSMGLTGTLSVIFNHILLPDSNVNEPRSHGFVSFRIRPRLPLLPGTVIENIANIFFDFNPPVITDPSVLTAEFSTGIRDQERSRFELMPNPARNHVTITCDNEMRRLRVITMDGRVVMQTSARGRVEVVDVADLLDGGYVIEVTDADGRVLRDRLIKQ